jgi:addiction module antidote protein, HigA family
MERLRNITPGEILLEEFLLPLDISQYRLAKELGIPQTRVSEIVKGNRRISADTAVRLSVFFGNSAKFWLGLQDDYDIENELQEKVKELKQIVCYREKTSVNKPLAFMGFK